MKFDQCRNILSMLIYAATTCIYPYTCLVFTVEARNKRKMHREANGKDEIERHTLVGNPNFVDSNNCMFGYNGLP
jgi:hypothetical protein